MNQAVNELSYLTDYFFSVTPPIFVCNYERQLLNMKRKPAYEKGQDHSYNNTERFELLSSLEAFGSHSDSNVWRCNDQKGDEKAHYKPVYEQRLCDAYIANIGTFVILSWAEHDKWDAAANG